MKITSSHLFLGIVAAFAVTVFAQQGPPESAVVSKSTTAFGYQVGGGSTKVGMKGTELLPGASGEAKVQARSGVTDIEVELQGLAAPSKLGTEFLTYVLWAVSPEGRTVNIGEIVVDNNAKGKLATSVQLQTFSLLVSAEPYFSVRQPSEMLVAENFQLKGTKGKVFPINDFKLMRRAVYAKQDNPLALTLDKNVPLEMYEARNAIEIARSRQSAKYASEIMTKAEASLKMAENALASKANKKEIVSTARQAIQFSEDARALSVQRQEEERIANEKAAAIAVEAASLLLVRVMAELHFAPGAAGRRAPS